MTLMNLLKGHDWYYGYSDDHSVWQRGRQQEAVIRQRLRECNCPFEIHQLRKAVQGMVFEKFFEESPGKWFRYPKKYSSVAPASESDLIHEADQVQILAWIENQG